MKALRNFSNEDKGTLLFNLFPDLMPELLQKLALHCQDIIERQEELSISWKFPDYIPFYYWLGLAYDVAILIEERHVRLENLVQEFAAGLFNERLYMFVADFIQRLSIALLDLWNYPQYNVAVKLLFYQKILPW
ncbi:hypothetical protein [Chitinophaga sp. CF418]|uniref:hypothetical protein n=1 Tax=Chitinophaga sp. CF418 TaxID=1855287 RepID=UPI000918E615|nr:hypothetical protein [Chitinophaga sp. CF418]SHN45568.1 hypothetical protein SAMN05216311_120112 [Chitinophaga sp. CF418]